MASARVSSFVAGAGLDSLEARGLCEEGAEGIWETKDPACQTVCPRLKAEDKGRAAWAWSQWSSLGECFWRQ
jgi:hypothetical protein